MKDENRLADIRESYTKGGLTEQEAGVDPYGLFEKWLSQAIETINVDANAMVLSTVNSAGEPSSRVVLLKGMHEGGLVFYTNYRSHKAEDMNVNNSVALNFFWKELERQVRIGGRVEKAPEDLSDAYFNSRPEGSRIGAWTSPQSQVIPDRDFLETRRQKYTSMYDAGDIPRPEHWGGYVVYPSYMEFWQGRASRLHDRIRFEKQENTWSRSRLAP